MNRQLQIPLGYRKNGRAIFRIAGGSEPAGVESQGQNNGGTGQQENPGQQNVQPQQQAGKPYDEYLQKLPEGVRPLVDGVFAEWDANTTKRFQEHTDKLKEYDPYKPYFDQYAPEALEYSVGLAQRLETKESAEEFFQELAQALGYQIDGAGQPQQNGQPFEDSNGGEQSPFADPRFQNVETAVGSLAQQFEQWTSSQQEQQQLQEAQKEWDAAVEKNKAMISGPDGQINKDAENMVLTIAAHQTGGDIDKAFAVYGAAVGKQAAAQNVPGQTAPIVGGGASNNLPSQQLDLANMSPKDRKAAAVAMLKAANAQKT